MFTKSPNHCIAFWTGICPLSLLASDMIVRCCAQLKIPKSVRIILVAMLCMSGYAFQLFQVSESYFSFGTVSQLEFESVSSVSEIPVVNFCHNYPTLQDADKLTFDTTFQGLIVKDHSVFISGCDQIYDHATLRRFTVFGLLCHSLTVNMTRPQSRITYTSKHWEIERAIIMTSYTKHAMMQLILSRILRDRFMVGWGESLSLNKSARNFRAMRRDVWRRNKSEFYFTLHGRSVSFLDPDSSIVSLSHGMKAVFAIISYQTIRKHLLPDPYDTHCKVYSNSTRFPSSADCYQTCYSNRYMATTGTSGDVPLWLRGARTRSDQSSPLVTYNAEMIKRDCMQRCQQDCDKIIFYPRIDHQSDFDDQDWHIAVQPSIQRIKITSSARTTLIMYLSLIVNSASFWFTFCPATFFLSQRFLSRCVTSADVGDESVVRLQRWGIQSRGNQSFRSVAEIMMKKARARQRWRLLSRSRMDIVLDHRLRMIGSRN